jgi:hypothetical protein
MRGNFNYLIKFLLIFNIFINNADRYKAMDSLVRAEF